VLSVGAEVDGSTRATAPSQPGPNDTSASSDRPTIAKRTELTNFSGTDPTEAPTP